MAITVANFITQYLRPVLASSTDYSDAILGYWITQALQDISRSFPRKTYALWNASDGGQYYSYADSLSVAIDTNIIRILNCLYPYVDSEDPGISLVRKSHLESDFYGGNYYEPDNDFGVLYLGPPGVAGQQIYADCHIVWAVSSGTPAIANPQEHYNLIVLFCVWQAFIQQMADAASATIMDTSLINSLALEVRRAEIAYRAAYTQLDEAKATSGVATGWFIDKWDKRGGG
jgi:hypothetical protein